MPRAFLPWWFRSCLALALAVIALPAVNLFGSALADLLRLPPGGTGRLTWDLGWLAASGVSSVAVATAVASRYRATHAAVAGALLVLTVAWAVMTLGDDFPTWFTALALLALPMQVWLGWRLGKTAPGRLS